MALVPGFNFLIGYVLQRAYFPIAHTMSGAKGLMLRDAWASWVFRGRPPQTMNGRLLSALREVWASDVPAVPGQRPIAATPGQPGQWLPYSSEPPDSGDLDGITPMPASAWPPGTWIVTSDGALVRWTGSGWSVASRSTLYQGLVLSQNPIAYWRLNEVAGLVAADSSVGANPGAYIGAPVLDVSGIAGSPGMGKTGVIEQGVDIVPIPAYATALPTQRLFTAECWYRASAPPATTHMALFWGDPDVGVSVLQVGVGADGFAGLVCSDGVGGIVWFGGGTFGPNVPMCDGQWHLVSFAIDAEAAVAQVYIDGVLAFSESGFTLPAMAPPSLHLYIGTVPPGLGETPDTPFEVDETVLYAGVQSAAAIAARYAVGRVVVPPDVVTSVTAGAPGFFSPATAPIPTKAELLAMGPLALEIIPMTPWPVGNYVLVATGEYMTWTGFEWLEITLDYAATILADNPLNYWRLNDVSGTVAVAAVGQHGTYTVPVETWVPRTPGAVADGACVTHPPAPDKRYIVMPLDASFGAMLNGGAWSVEYWWTFPVVPPIDDGATIFLANGPVPGAFVMGADNTNLTFRLRDAADVYSEVNLVPITAINTWHHIVVTCSGGVLRGYVNGALRATKPGASPGPFQNPTELCLCNDAQSPQYHFNGALAEVALYAHALSDAQVLAHYNARL